MSIAMPQVYALGRQALTFSMGVVAAGAATHIFSGGQSESATQALNQISTGVESIIAGATTLIGIGSAVYAAWSASPLNQVKAAAAVIAPTGGKIVTTPMVAAQTPDQPNIISHAQDMAGQAKTGA